MFPGPQFRRCRADAPGRNKAEEQVKKPATLGKEQPVKELKMHQPHGQGKQEHQGGQERARAGV